MRLLLAFNRLFIKAIHLHIDQTPYRTHVIRRVGFVAPGGGEGLVLSKLAGFIVGIYI